MLSLLQVGVLERVEEFRAEFAAGEPFPHIVIDNFLDPEYCCRLSDEFPAFDAEKARNEFGEIGGKAVHQNLPGLGPAYKDFDRMIRSRDFLTWVEAVTGISKLLYDPDYVGGGTHENLDGQDLDPHVDFNYHPTRGLHRRLNLLLFLNPKWREDWGGSLELHRSPWLRSEENHVKTIRPIENRIVLFETSERSWHGFSKIRFQESQKDLSRRSIAVYFYTQARPEQEIVPSHATIYVPRKLPRHIQAGHTLREQDVEALQTLIERRDRQLQFLYERELKFSHVIERILRSPSHRIGRFVTWPVRKLLRRN